MHIVLFRFRLDLQLFKNVFWNYKVFLKSSLGLDTHKKIYENDGCRRKKKKNVFTLLDINENNLKCLELWKMTLAMQVDAKTRLEQWSMLSVDHRDKHLLGDCVWFVLLAWTEHGCSRHAWGDISLTLQGDRLAFMLLFTPTLCWRCHT